MEIKARKIGSLLCFSFLLSETACAASEKKTDASNSSQDQHATISSDQRKAMAEMHQKMADCLKTDKSLQECQNQMRQNCQRCDGMMWHQGMGHHHGMMGRGMMGHGMDSGYCGMRSDSDATNQ